MRKATTRAKRKPIPAGRRSTATPKTTKAKSSKTKSVEAKSPAKPAKSIAKAGRTKAKYVKPIAKVAAAKAITAPKGKSTDTGKMTKMTKMTTVAAKARPIAAVPAKAPVAVKMPVPQVPRDAEKHAPDKLDTRSAGAEPRPHAPSGHAAGAKARDVKKSAGTERGLERSSGAHAATDGSIATGAPGSADRPADATLPYGLPTPIASFTI